MNMQIFLTLYALSVPVFFAIDMVWLGVVAKNFYRSQLGDLLGDVRWVPAIIFYLVFLVGVTIFATYPGAVKHSVSYALLYGALFGFFSYATYDLTNLATLRNWPLSVTLVDMVWGAVLGGVVAALTVTVYQWFA
jgi:uncharacterized membrane protein